MRSPFSTLFGIAVNYSIHDIEVISLGFFLFQFCYIMEGSKDVALVNVDDIRAALATEKNQSVINALKLVLGGMDNNDGNG